jgi:hypothetical protein
MTWSDWLCRLFCPARYTAARIDDILRLHREREHARPVPAPTSAPHAQFVFDL